MEETKANSTLVNATQNINWMLTVLNSALQLRSIKKNSLIMDDVAKQMEGNIFFYHLFG